jgi:hypothetical protein
MTSDIKKNDIVYLAKFHGSGFACHILALCLHGLHLI